MTLCDIYCREEADWVTGDSEPDGPGQEGAFHPRLRISHHCSRSAYTFFQIICFSSTFLRCRSFHRASFDLNSSVADPGCLSRIPNAGSRIRILDLDFFPCRIRILDPGVKQAPDPGSATLEF
jgi:hypothetical protein